MISLAWVHKRITCFSTYPDFFTCIIFEQDLNYNSMRGSIFLVMIEIDEDWQRADGWEEKKDMLLLRDYRTQISLATRFFYRVKCMMCTWRLLYYLGVCVCAIQLTIARLSPSVWIICELGAITQHEPRAMNNPRFS